MNREKVLELAREAELARQFALEVPFVVDRLERFAALVEAEHKLVLHQLLNILGPTAPTCCGCAVEWQAAIDLIRKELE